VKRHHQIRTVLHIVAIQQVLIHIVRYSFTVELLLQFQINHTTNSKPRINTTSIWFIVVRQSVNDDITTVERLGNCTSFICMIFCQSQYHSHSYKQ
jgi:hypothetical protein